MTKPSRSSVIGTRVSVDARARFAALAARHELSEARLLATMVNEVLRANDPSLGEAALLQLASDSTVHGVAEDRITLRLRPGDRALISERASARGMKTCSYLAMLVHNHVRAPAVLPPGELDQLRVTCAHLSALGRQLRMFGTPNTPATPVVSVVASELSETIAKLRREVEAAREATTAVVRWNLRSWETGGELSHV